MDSGFWFEAGALLPSIGVGLIFWFAIRSLLRADRREREADREVENDVRAMREAERAKAKEAESEQRP
ncbi:hypothetical protein [Brachybacterium aquaticum]|uniref:Uncharacterized protein n=1 Tax=Brachybacterium aquaticum TaxID=1432564 RepID=A0A841ACT3_9MICO|nr:hypothetical protein [Brachybacterium aquaticum]MBB5831743.1 hypothetical protein [Brachybacterium aquaticum]